MHNCLICQRIELIKQKKNVCFVLELPTSYVVFGDHQFYLGYTLLLSKTHAHELHQLSHVDKTAFLNEMSLVAQAVFDVFKPEKLNYELLGNTDKHLHWHIYPRHLDDPAPLKPIWSHPKSVRCTSKTKITTRFIKKYQPLLALRINELIDKEKSMYE